MTEAFRCRREGLSALLGGYDGVGSWMTVLPHLRSGEQRMVEAHESLHHELQASTAWGRLTAFSHILATHGHRRLMLFEIFAQMVEASGQTHECFATLVSVAVTDLHTTRALLADNPEYLGHLDRACALAGSEPLPWQFRETAASIALRCCMAPAGLTELLEAGFEKLRRGDLDLAINTPDLRLTAFEQAGGPGGWGRVFAEVLTRHPDRGGDRGGEDGRIVPDDPAARARLRAFEEDVLAPSFYAYCCRVLDDHGLPSMPWTSLMSSAESQASAVRRMDPRVGDLVQPVSGRRRAEVDSPEFHRQGLALREPLPIELVGSAETFSSIEAFELADRDGDRCVLGLWADRGAVLAQFAAFSTDDPPTQVAQLQRADTLAVLLAPAKDGDGRLTARMGVLPDGMTPAECQAAMGTTPLVVLTTHSSLIDPDEQLRRSLLAVEPIYVLMDLPVEPQVEAWIRQGASVTFAMASLARHPTGELAVIMFSIDAAPGLRFLSIGSELAVHGTLQRLSVAEAEADWSLCADPGLLRADRAATELAIAVILATWHQLDEGG